MGVSPPGQLDLGGVPQRPAEQVWNGASSAAEDDGGGWVMGKWTVNGFNELY